MVVTSSKAIRFPPSALDAVCTLCTGRRVPSADTDTRLSLACKARVVFFLMASAAFFATSSLASALAARAATDSALFR